MLEKFCYQTAYFHCYYYQALFAAFWLRFFRLYTLQGVLNRPSWNFTEPSGLALWCLFIFIDNCGENTEILSYFISEKTIHQYFLFWNLGSAQAATMRNGSTGGNFFVLCFIWLPFSFLCFLHFEWFMAKINESLILTNSQTLRCEETIKAFLSVATVSIHHPTIPLVSRPTIWSFIYIWISLLIIYISNPDLR